MFIVWNFGFSCVYLDYVMFFDVDDYIENKLVGGLFSVVIDIDVDFILGFWWYGGDDCNYGVIRRLKMMMV